MTRRRDLAIPLLLTAAMALALFQIAWRGWIPHDEGLMAQSAERLLSGEVPHRDFFDAYTGGLTALHALTFQLLGTTLGSLRWTLLAAILSMVPTLHALASRAVPPVWAALVVIAALAWGPAVYFAPLPTWYTTVLAVHATWCLLRYAETGRRWWLLAAGLLGGLSVTVKIVGLFQVAAALLFLLLLAQTGGPSGRDEAAPSPLARWAPVSAAVVLGALVLATVWPRIGPWPVIVLVVPATIGAMALGARRAVRRAPILAPAAWYLAGVCLPVGALALVYARLGALTALVDGVLVAPARRVDLAAMDLRLAWSALPLAAAWGAVSLAGRASHAHGVVALVTAASLALVLVLFGAQPDVHHLAWSLARLAGPVVALVGAVTVWRAKEPLAPEAVERVRALFLMATTAGLMGLVQYPYAFGVYLAYTAPLVAVAAAHMAAGTTARLLPLHGVALVGAILFALLWVDRCFVRASGVAFVAAPPMRRLELPRAGGLEVPVEDALAYEAVHRAVTSHSGDHDALLALPDCPEVYFLCARRNPTRTMYDAFDEDFAARARRAARLVEVIDRQQLRVAVLQGRGEFSGPLDRGTVAAILSRLPAGERAGPFTVVWRP